MKRDGQHVLVHAAESKLAAARGEVEELHRAVLAGRGELGSIGAEREGIDEVRMPAEGLQLGEAFHVPDLHLLIEASGREFAALQIEGDREDDIIMSAQ